MFFRLHCQVLEGLWRDKERKERWHQMRGLGFSLVKVFGFGAAGIEAGARSGHQGAAGTKALTSSSVPGRCRPEEAGGLCMQVIRAAECCLAICSSSTAVTTFHREEDEAQGTIRRQWTDKGWSE